MLYVQTVLVEVFLLGPWVENAEVGLRVGTVADCPLPSARVLHGRVVGKLVGEVFLSFSPVQKQVFREEVSDDHSATVVHMPSGIHLPHGSINNREASLGLFPKSEMVLIILPGHIIKLGLKALALVIIVREHPGMIMRNIHIKIPPNQLTNKIVVTSKCLEHTPINLSDGHCREMQVG